MTATFSKEVLEETLAENAAVFRCQIQQVQDLRHELDQLRAELYRVQRERASAAGRAEHYKELWEEMRKEHAE